MEVEDKIVAKCKVFRQRTENQNEMNYENNQLKMENDVTVRGEDLVIR